jgi:hypothetical protein
MILSTTGMGLSLKFIIYESTMDHPQVEDNHQLKVLHLQVSGVSLYVRYVTLSIAVDDDWELWPS